MQTTTVTDVGISNYFNTLFRVITICSGCESEEAAVTRPQRNDTRTRTDAVIVKRLNDGRRFMTGFLPGRSAYDTHTRGVAASHTADTRTYTQTLVASARCPKRRTVGARLLPGYLPHIRKRPRIACCF